MDPRRYEQKQPRHVRYIAMEREKERERERERERVAATVKGYTSDGIHVIVGI